MTSVFVVQHVHSLGDGEEDAKFIGVYSSREKADAAVMGTIYMFEKDKIKPVRVSVGITDNRFTEIVGDEIKEGAAVIIEDLEPVAKDSGSKGMRLF